MNKMVDLPCYVIFQTLCTRSLMLRLMNLVLEVPIWGHEGCITTLLVESGLPILKNVHMLFIRFT
jgi:hypothetical protein